MGRKGEDAMELRVSKAVRSAFEQLIRDIENEPSLILEIDKKPDTEETTLLREISSQLFRRRDSDDGTDNGTNN